MIIAIGTKNSAKVQAVRELILNYSALCFATVRSVSTSSNVSDQPLTLEETIQGAKSRALNAYELVDGCTFGIGIESGLFPCHSVRSEYLHTCAGCVFDGKNYYLGLSTSFEVPPHILKHLIDDHMDLAQACLHVKITKDQNIGMNEGLVGLLTNGRVNRKDYSKECLTMALIQLENAHLFK
ncbi:MAG: DUF84 family protein [Parachlamydiales bacterium]|nr:DUF84 family protein [Parachlamydiales bacterium]